MRLWGSGEAQSALGFRLFIGDFDRRIWVFLPPPIDLRNLQGTSVSLRHWPRAFSRDSGRPDSPPSGPKFHFSYGPAHLVDDADLPASDSRLAFHNPADR